MPNDIAIRTDIRCGDLGRIIELHGTAYEKLPGFGLRFEAFVARTIAEYVLDNASKGRVWLAERGDRLVGCTAIALRDDGLAQLRWVLVDDSARGLGLGGRLVDEALAYCRRQGCRRVFLETTDGLPESSALYDKLGFSVIADDTIEMWDGPRPRIHMELGLEP